MTDLHNTGDMEELFGPEYKFSDHKRGENIRFRDAELGELTGTILWVCAPGELAGTHIPMQYVVEPEHGGFPSMVHRTDIIEG